MLKPSRCDSRDDLPRSGCLCLYPRSRVVDSIFYLRKSHSPHPRRALTGKGAFCIHAAALLGILCLAYAYWIEPTWIEVKPIKLCCNKFNAGSLRLIQISDTHCDLKERNETRVVEIINELKPDVIVFTGDALNDIGALPTFQKMLGSLKASIGKFAIRGNIDNHYYRSMDCLPVRDSGTSGYDPHLRKTRQFDHHFRANP